MIQEVQDHLPGTERAAWLDNRSYMYVHLRSISQYTLTQAYFLPRPLYMQYADALVFDGRFDSHTKDVLYELLRVCLSGERRALLSPCGVCAYGARPSFIRAATNGRRTGSAEGVRLATSTSDCELWADRTTFCFQISQNCPLASTQRRLTESAVTRVYQASQSTPTSPRRGPR